MARFNTAVERANSFSFEEGESKLSIFKRIGGKVVAVAGIVSAAAAINMASANAEEVVGAGGMGDPSSHAYENMLRATGQLGPNDTYHPIPNPASIWPLGPVTAGETVRQGVINGHAALDRAIQNAAPGERVVIRGYSEGGMIAAELARQRFGDRVAEGTVVIDGSPVSEAGVFNPQDPLVKAMLPLMTNMLDVPAHIRAPAGSIVRGSERDVWFNGGPSNIGTLLGQGIDTMFGPAHAVQHANGHYYVVVGADGITRHVYPGLGTGGIPPNALTMGGVDPGAPGVPPVAPPVAHVQAPPAHPFPAQRREVVEAPVSSRATNSVAQPVQRQNVQSPYVPQVKRTERSTTLTNKKTGKRARVTSHVSIVATPGKGASRK